jgi:hypothetical protein
VSVDRSFDCTEPASDFHYEFISKTIACPDDATPVFVRDPACMPAKCHDICPTGPVGEVIGLQLDDNRPVDQQTGLHFM